MCTKKCIAYLLYYKCKKKGVNTMTNKEYFKKNAEKHGLTVLETETTLQWVTLNGAWRMTYYFDEKGNYLRNEREILK